jgi:hypothetical protein
VSGLKQAARLAIADPPYPPRTCADGSRIARASRWYGDGQRSRKDSPADFHPDAARWDDPAEHRLLLERLDATYDGWAIATTPDGLSAYGELPPAARIMAWVKRNGAAGSHRIRGCWEAVIVSPPPGPPRRQRPRRRRPNRRATERWICRCQAGAVGHLGTRRPRA